ncbi:MAG: hypothetical protein PHE78_08465 [Candidatus Gastranaerophilales bacterium]|nr:hypothetical protein [Candidatus Gastranaerophilales bacterium]
MDEEQKKLLTIGVIAILLVLAMFVMCSKSPNQKKSGSGKNTSNASSNNRNVTSNKTENQQDSVHSTHYSTSNSSNYYATKEVEVPVFSAKTLENNKRFKEKALTRQREYIKKRTQELLDDPKTSPAKKLKARLITSKSYVEAFTAFKNKDYKTAIKAYHAVFADENSTPEMKYIALEGLQDSSRKIKDLELFILAAKEMGKLIKSADLSLLDITKTEDYYEWSLRFETFMKADLDISLRQRLIDDEMKQYMVTRAKAERTVQRQITTYKSLFKEFVNQ